VNLTWTDAPAAHAAQIYVEADELAESVAEYFAAGFEAGEPAVLVATEEHANLVAERLAAAGWDAFRIEELGLLVAVDAETTLGQIMEGQHPSPVAFERVIGGLLDALGERFHERRVRAFGEMVNVLCERGQRDAAVELEELWNDLARTRNFSLLCGYRLDVFDRSSQRRACRGSALARATPAIAANGAARRPEPDAWRATLRKATRTRRLS
jgi:hypothetical protein